MKKTKNLVAVHTHTHTYTLKQLKKSEKGITLIALIVTIIILMVLAGVTVATISGNKGILNKSKLAQNEYQNSANEENNKIGGFENEIDIASSRNINADKKYEEIILFSNDKGVTSGKIVFSDNHLVDEFDEILFVHGYLTHKIVETRITKTSWNYAIERNTGTSLFAYSDRVMDLGNLTSKSFTIDHCNYDCCLFRVYGIKY